MKRTVGLLLVLSALSYGAIAIAGDTTPKCDASGCCVPCPEPCPVPCGLCD